MWPLVRQSRGAGVVIRRRCRRGLRGASNPLETLRDAVERLGARASRHRFPKRAWASSAASREPSTTCSSASRNYVDERTRILAAMSHDLRTPLTRLRMQAEYVGDEHQRAEMLREMRARWRR